MPDERTTSTTGAAIATATMSAPPSAAGAAPLVVVRAAVAPMHAEARVSSAQTSQALAGHVLLVHETAGDWLRVAGVDGYAAWAHRGYLAASDDDGAVEARLGVAEAPWAPAGAPTLLDARNRRASSASLGCVARGAAGPRALPLGALLEDAPWGGEPARERLESGAAVGRAEQGARFPRDAAAVAASAATLFAGTSYQWGGVTPWGADCSGFVQAVFRLHGAELPRDAWQQALAGAPAAERVAELGPGDLLFFSDRDDRRITHVGVALGGSRMAHVALGRGGFAVERLDDVADPYVARLVRQQVAARRVVE